LISPILLKLTDGTKLIVADGKGNKLAEKASLNLDLEAGNEGSFLLKLHEAIESETGDEGFVKAAKILKAAVKPVIVYGQDFAANADDKAFETLVGISESLNASLVGVKGNANSMAASQLGLESPIKVNGYKSAFIMLGDENPSQKLIKSLEKVSFVVALSAYSSQLTGNAEVVLPVTIWAEQSGTYLNMDGRLQKAVQSLEAPEGVLTSRETLLKISEALATETDTDWKTSILSRIPTVEIKEA